MNAHTPISEHFSETARCFFLDRRLDHAFELRSMTKCVKVLQSNAEAKSIDQSQARMKPFRPKSEPMIGPCFLLLLCSLTL
jgi:hypothetical protein